MNPFQPTGPEIPPAPIEIPTPAIPPADFSLIGAQLERGRQKAAAEDTSGLGWLHWIPDIVVAILTAVLSVWEWIVAKLLGILIRILQGGEAGSEEITDTVLGGLLAGKHEARSVSLVQALMGALGGGGGGPGAAGITPSSTGAENFLRLSSRLAIESWVWGVVTEEGTLGFLKNFGGLKDALEDGLGLSRLARRALAPPMKVLVEDPFTWLLNNTYRPKLLAEEQAVRQFLRGIIDRSELDRQLGYQGYSAAAIEAAINYNRVHLSVSDLATLVRGQVLDVSYAKTLLAAQGYDDTTANMALELEAVKRKDALTLEIAKVAVDEFGLGHLGEPDLEFYINDPALQDYEKTYLKVLADLKRKVARAHVTIAQAVQLVERGIWTIDNFRELAMQLGYTPQDELDLELLLLSKVTDKAAADKAKAAAAAAKAEAAKVKAAAAAQKAALAAQEAEAKGISIAKFETLVKDGVKTVAEYRTFLQGKLVAPDNIDALATVLQAALDKAAAATPTKAAAAAKAKAKNLSLAQLEQSVKDGLITMAEYQARLENSGVSPEDASLLVELLTDQANQAAVKVKTKAAAKAAAAVKHVDLAQEERAVRLGLATIADYTAFLTAHGYAAEDVTLLTGELQAQLAADAAARKTKAGVASALKAKGVSLATLERAVRAGVSTIADYQAALAAQGYDSPTQAMLVSLLQLQMENDQQTLAASGKAAALLAQHGVSLADLARAAKLGVVPVATYTDALTRSGLGQADVQTLTLSLAAQIKGAKQATKAAPTVAKLLTAAGLSLPALEKDVLDGKLTLAQFQAQLAGAGAASADQAALVQLLTDELANAAAIGAKLTTAAQRAAAKGLSLAEETAAVRAGVKTLQDYSRFVADLGFDPADVQTLTATLQAQLAKAAAPAAKKPAVPTLPPGTP